MFDYDEDSKKAAETLDKYDFTPILKRCYGVDIYDIEDWIKDYGDDVAEAVENLADYELADYLHQKIRHGDSRSFLDTALGGMTESKVE